MFVLESKFTCLSVYLSRSSISKSPELYDCWNLVGIIIYSNLRLPISPVKVSLLTFNELQKAKVLRKFAWTIQAAKSTRKILLYACIGFIEIFHYFSAFYNFIVYETTFNPFSIFLILLFYTLFSLEIRLEWKYTVLV